MPRELVAAGKVLQCKREMKGKKFIERDSQDITKTILAGPRALAVLARRAMLKRPPPKSGGSVPASQPKKPKPIIDGAEATVE